MRWLILLIFAIYAIQVSAQPGDEGTMTLFVTDESGKPVREAKIRQTHGRFIDNAFPPAADRGFKPLFIPTDGERSSFVAQVHCRKSGAYSFEVSAAGYSHVEKNGNIGVCPEKVTVVLKRNPEPLPEYEKLTLVSGSIINNFGQAITDGFSIRGPNGEEYLPRISENGKYSVQLKSGDHAFHLRTYGCTEHEIKNYPVGAENKVLDFRVECRERR